MSAKTTARAYLLRGDDDFAKRGELERLLDTLVEPEFADFDLEQMEGDGATADRVLAGLQVPPFGSRRRAVLVRYANKMHPDEQRRLATRLDAVPESACLIMVFPAPEKVDGRPRRGSEVVGDLSKAIRKVGKVITTGGEKSREKAGRAREFVASVFAEAGKKIQPPAAALLIERAGTDLMVLQTEARKLIDYTGDSKLVTAADVSSVTSETPEERIFKLIDAVAVGDRAAAMRLLRLHLDAAGRPEEEAPRAISMLARQFRLIWQWKTVEEAGIRNPAEAAVPDSVRSMLPAEPNLLEILGRQPWMARSLAGQARPFTRQRLARCFELIAEADREIKGIGSGTDDPRLSLELLVVRLAGLRSAH